MLLEGLKLMVIGMTTVLLFLSLMIVLIHAVSRLTRDLTAREFEKQQVLKKQALKKQAAAKAKKKSTAKPSPKPTVPMTEEIPVAVFAAAIAAFEADKRNRR